MDLEFRSLNILDAQMLLDFAKRAFIDSYSHLNTPENMEIYLDENFTIEKIKTELSDSANIFSGIFSGPNLVAYSKLRPNNYNSSNATNQVIELERIYVAKEYHGLKMGKLLMNHCKEYAKSKNFSELWLGVWDQNEKAIAFYKKMGFEIFSSHVFVLGTEKQNDYLMRIIF